MKLYSIFDPEFRPYGRVVDHDFSTLIERLHNTECPNDAVIYVASDASLEADKESFDYLKNEVYGGMPIQIGFCNGRNNKLNCLEWHADSEINIAEYDAILLLAQRADIVDNKLDTATVKAFLVPAGKAVEVYATALHYAPCGKDNELFRMVIVLPRGTNADRPAECKDPLIFAKNKWLLAHPEAGEANQGAVVGLVGENITL